MSELSEVPIKRERVAIEHNDSNNNNHVEDPQIGEEAMDTEEGNSNVAMSSSSLTSYEDEEGDIQEPAIGVDLTDDTDNNMITNDDLTFRYTLRGISSMRPGDKRYSRTHMIKDVPWRVLFTARNNSMEPDAEPFSDLGCFIQCNVDDTPVAKWRCYTTVEIRLLSHKSATRHLTRKFQKMFHSREEDWGYYDFISFEELIDPQHGFYVHDEVTFEFRVDPGSLFGVSDDCRRKTGYVGLKNQGATCYMNSVLQTLYFTNKLRKAIYLMPTDNENVETSVAMALQAVFYKLQFSRNAVVTKGLTNSFGWNAADTGTQHDVQEMFRILLENLEKKMKGTIVDSTIPNLLKGKSVSYIKCHQVTYESRKDEEYYDIQLSVKEKKDVYESFRDYIAPEVLEGQNKYDAGPLGFSDADKGVEFIEFPPVLYLHLLRFTLDPQTYNYVKISSRYEFPEELSLDRFLKKKSEDDPADYRLHAVLVHSGTLQFGHYKVFINREGDGKWFQFNDDTVTSCTSMNAINDNYGGQENNGSAYMLVYIRKSQLSSVLAPVAESDLPECLLERMKLESAEEEKAERERQEQHLYMTVNLVTSENCDLNQGPELFEFQFTAARHFKVKKDVPLREFINHVAKSFNYTENQIRLWTIDLRSNKTWRPKYAFNEEFGLDKCMSQVESTSFSTTPLFLETITPDQLTEHLPAFSHEQHVLLFLKKYIPETKSMLFCGHVIMPLNARIDNFLVPIMLARGKFPEDTRLSINEEVDQYCIQEIRDFSSTVLEAMEDLMDGDILVFQVSPDSNRPRIDSRYATAKDFYREYSRTILIQFIDCDAEKDTGFTLPFSIKDNYSKLLNVLSECIDTDENLIQLFHNHRQVDGKGNPIKAAPDDRLLKVFLGYSQERERKLFYHKSKIPVAELKHKRVLKCHFVDSSLKQLEELVLYPNKGGYVSDILDEAQRQLTAEYPNVNRLRLLEVMAHKIRIVYEDDMLLDSLILDTTKSYRIEPVPLEDIIVNNNEILVPVVHFNKYVGATFGVPFLIKIRQNEKYSRVRERIQTKLALPDDEFQSYRLVIVQKGMIHDVDDKPNYTVQISDFLSPKNLDVVDIQSRYLGLSHVNKSANVSKNDAIVIHN